jgi:hypothetical protein
MSAVSKVADRFGQSLVSMELSQRGIANSLLPEDHPDDALRIIQSGSGYINSGYINVKVCHRDQSNAFVLREIEARWRAKRSNEFCVFVLLSGSWSKILPQYWIAYKREVSDLCIANSANETFWEHHFSPDALPQNWKNRWSLFDFYQLGANLALPNHWLSPAVSIQPAT